MIESILNHRTIRKYKETPIDEQLLTSILLAGTRASTTGNMQVYSIVNTESVELKQQLAPAHFNQQMVTTVPNVLTFCADFNRFNQWCVFNGAEPGYDNFLSFITAAIDALLVAQNVALAAEANGLGICYLGTTIYNADKIIEVLKLPKGVVPITTLTMGWPDESPELTDRLPLEAILHQEVYQEYNQNRIKDLYSEKENLPANKQFVAENNKPSLAHVFTDVRYKKTDNEFFSAKLLAVLKQQGFLLKSQ
jgi:nitroreductase